MFELCDDDDDGCMRPDEILNMLQRTERIFAKEISKVDIQSTILLNLIADKKAEQKFQRIMGQIRQQSINKQLEQAKKDKALKDSVSGDVKQSDVKIVSSQEFEQDNLITQREFMQAIKSIKDADDPNPNEQKFYGSLLPRTLTFS